MSVMMSEPNHEKKGDHGLGSIHAYSKGIKHSYKLYIFRDRPNVSMLIDV